MVASILVFEPQQVSEVADKAHVVPSPELRGKQGPAYGLKRLEQLLYPEGNYFWYRGGKVIRTLSSGCIAPEPRP